MGVSVNNDISNNNVFLGLELSPMFGYELRFSFHEPLGCSDSIKKAQNMLIEINKLIKNQDFYKYKEFYEHIYLYSSMCSLFYSNVSPFEISNHIIYSKDYKYINEYVEIYKKQLKVLDEGCGILEVNNNITIKDKLIDSREDDDDSYEDEICKELNLLKNKLANGWLEESKDLTIENFYEKSYKNLNKLNKYVKREIEVNEFKK